MQETSIRPPDVQPLVCLKGGIFQSAAPQGHACFGTERPGTTTDNEEDRGAVGAPRVLIVEDDTLTSLDLECMVEGRGYEVVGVVNRVGLAMDFLNKHTERIDCAILDVQVAGQTCLPITEVLDGLGVPYLFVTGHDRDTVHMLGLRGEVIEKPFLDQHLETHLSKLVGAR